MHHVSGAWSFVKRALDNISMKPVRLSVGVDQPVLLACDDADRHFQGRILILEVEGARYHESGFRSRCSNLRRAYRQFFWKSGKLWRNGLGTEDPGHQKRPNSSAHNRCDTVPQDIADERHRGYR